MSDLRNIAAFFRNPEYVKHGFPGHLIELLADELESVAAEIERQAARIAELEGALEKPCDPWGDAKLWAALQEDSDARDDE